MYQDELTEWQLKYDKDAKYCIECNKSIWYENTKAKISSKGKNKGMPIYTGTYYNTHKSIDNKIYYIQRCSCCLEKEIPSYSEKNKSRILNTLNEYVSYAFNLSLDFINEINKKRVPTLNNMIVKYGKKIGTDKWNSYLKKQSISNTFEYKKKIHGWDKKKFEKYNKSRAVTLENLIHKYGKRIGTNKWNSYLEKQKKTKSKEYVIQHKGLQYWIDLCNSKKNTLDNFIKRYGESKGIIKYENYINKFSIFVKSSRIANDFFNDLTRHDEIFKKYTIYYDDKGGEFGKYCKSNKKYYFIDFYIKELKLGIEFNGNYFHANPLMYNENSTFWHTDLNFKEIRDRDIEKNKIFKNEHGIDIITVWESDLEYKEKTIKKIINIIKNR